MFSRLLFGQFNRLPVKYSILYYFAFVLFFWGLFDASYSYLAPIVLTASGYSKTFMGIILGSSSVFGALFDIILSKYLHNTDFRRVFILMFGLCLLAQLLLIKNNPLLLLLIAMVVWGMYFDLSNFGSLDFVSRKIPSANHISSFGILWVARCLAYTVGPLIIGGVIGLTITKLPYILLYLYISIAIFFFLFLLYHFRNDKANYIKENPSVTITEIITRKKIIQILFPYLLITMFFWVYDAFFWTLGPLVGQTLAFNPQLAGLFLAFYTLPPFALSFFTKNIAEYIGAKKTVIIIPIIASILLCAFFKVTNKYDILSIEWVASCCIALLIPTLNAIYSEYITTHPQYEKEIEAMQDFSTNIGYFIGPILAGILADNVGTLKSFSYLGLIGIITMIFAILIRRPSRNIKK